MGQASRRKSENNLKLRRAVRLCETNLSLSVSCLDEVATLIEQVKSGTPLTAAQEVYYRDLPKLRASIAQSLDDMTGIAASL